MKWREFWAALAFFILLLTPSAPAEAGPGTVLEKAVKAK